MSHKNEEEFREFSHKKWKFLGLPPLSSISSKWCLKTAKYFKRGFLAIDSSCIMRTLQCLESISNIFIKHKVEAATHPRLSRRAAAV